MNCKNDDQDLRLFPLPSNAPNSIDLEYVVVVRNVPKYGNYDDDAVITTGEKKTLHMKLVNGNYRARVPLSDILDSEVVFYLAEIRISFSDFTLPGDIPMTNSANEGDIINKGSIVFTGISVAYTPQEPSPDLPSADTSITPSTDTSITPSYRSTTLISVGSSLGALRPGYITCLVAGRDGCGSVNTVARGTVGMTIPSDDVVYF